MRAPRNTILQLSTRYTDLTPQTPHHLNRRRWCHLANKLKPYCKEANRRNVHVLNRLYG